MKGKLIVIEGLDGSGKGTQTPLLCESLIKDGKAAEKLSFPCYESDSSALVKMYLDGKFGTDVNSIGPYAASSFYAVDRFASFVSSWGKKYNSGGLFVADRYATSNMIYQAGKLSSNVEKDEFINWVEDFEYTKLGIPKPDLVIYLDMPVSISQNLLKGRYNGDESKKDLHERNVAFLNRCRESALYAAEKCGWRIIECSDGKQPFSVEQIHDEIMKNVAEVIL